jgi:LuxR family maltose regulon positive regulatory protein
MVMAPVAAACRHSARAKQGDGIVAIHLLEPDYRPDAAPLRPAATRVPHLDAVARTERAATSRRPETAWLLPTKLVAPSPRPQHTTRPRVLARLEADLQRPLTVVAAPAGFGKTTLLADWRATPAGAARPLAWVSLDAGDNDPVRFWSYLVAALRSASPEVGQTALAVLRSPGAAPETVVPAIVRDLAGLRHDLVLVLDDYEAIVAEPIHRGMVSLLEHAPRHLHVVVLSRSEPRLPLARLRARGQLAEIGADLLRFDADEATTLLARALARPLPESVVEALVAATEGWVAGLHLVALAVEGQAEPAEILTHVSAGHRFVVDFLVEEVLHAQPASVQEFLLQTSILERLSGDLCNAVTGRDDGQLMLERLERAHLFVVPLDDERRWYRYHRLFGEALRQRLGGIDPSAITDLHARASAWLERHGLVGEAIEHALAARDWPTAMRLIEPLVLRLYERGERATLARWLAALPVDLLDGNPRFALVRAWSYFWAGRLEEAERLGQAAAARAEAADDATALARAFQLLSHLAAAQGNGAAAIAHGERALTLVPADDSVHRRWVLYGIGLGQLLLGNLTDAARLLDQAGASGLAAGQDLLGGGVVLSHVGLIHALRGDPTQAERIYRDLLGRPGDALRTSHSAALVRLADLLREQDRLSEAAELLDEAIPLAKQCSGLYTPEGLIALARLHAARSSPDEALATFAEAETAAGLLGHATAAGRARAFAARLRLAAGDLLAAARWAAGLGLSEAELGQYEHEVAALTLVRVWIAQGRPERGLALLDRVRPLAEAAGRVASVVEMLALEALAQAACGDEQQSVVRLAQAAAVAERSGYARLLVDDGVPMARLLEALVAARRRGTVVGRAPSGQYLQWLLASFSGQVVEPVVAAPAARLTADRSLVPVEPLSAREREVLALMATGAGNQQIADRLVVAVTTVKTHVNGIFRKLDATSRIEAVTRARELGLLGQAAASPASRAIPA